MIQYNGRYGNRQREPDPKDESTLHLIIGSITIIMVIVFLVIFFIKMN